MQQLDPKAVWLFFIRYFFVGLFFFVFIGGFFWSMVVPLAIMSVGSRYISSIIAVTATTAILIFLTALIFAYIWARLSYRFYRYELTDMGFRKELGVIWKKYVTIPYDRIQNVDIYRGVMARILGLSDLNIQTAGASAAVGRYGAAGMGAEGRLPGLSKEVAEQVRDALIQRARQSRSPGV